MEVRESKGSSSRREVRNGFFHLERKEKSKKREAEEYTRENEGGQARVTRWIEYLRGTPFARKIERCSSIKGASYTRRKITRPRKEFVRGFRYFLLFCLVFSPSCISNRLVGDKDKQFLLAHSCPPKIETTSCRVFPFFHS